MPLRKKPSVISVACCISVIAIAFGFFSHWFVEDDTRQGWKDAAIRTEVCAYKRTGFGVDRVDCKIRLQSDAPSSDLHLKSLMESGVAFVSKSGRPDSAILMTGQKSILAGNDEFMSMGIAELENGSLVRDGTIVEFLHGDGALVEAITRGGIAYNLRNSPTEAGYIQVTGKIGNITTQSNTLRVVPAEPVMVAIEERVKAGLSINDQQFWLKSKPLKDQFGNVLNDGSYVQFAGQDSMGRPMFLNAIVVNGVAASKFIKREMTGQLKVAARYRDVIGGASNFNLGSLDIREDFEVAGRQKGSTANLTIGPILHQNGVFVSDGMSVELILPDKRQFSAKSYQGKVDFRYSFDNGVPINHARMRIGSKIWELTLNASGISTAKALQSSEDFL